MGLRSGLTARVPVSALLLTGVAAIVLTAILAGALGTATDRADVLAEDLAIKSSNYDSMKSAWQELGSEVSTLRSTVKTSDKREADLAAAETAQSTRATELDAREAAVKGAEDVAAANTFAGEGTFRVGADVQPGTYTSDGGSNCYWARLNATGDDIIDNDLSSGPAVVTVQASDGLIKTSRCAPLTKTG
ncbi:hypothetical protein [Cryobacterium roopkundense]|uniref:Uncharacterized protein n=1 Tax=Cryobacterium roopkundense TaxID=1001240 RepID=A0A7W8ZVE9_9MICO|nr:hypothetical protein [Cryobacterium roopkundense]MBB5640953.1 hypothetical protein [Cryobacterium roopkundense]